jgi:hypothetical protein
MFVQFSRGAAGASQPVRIRNDSTLIAISACT